MLVRIYEVQIHYKIICFDDDIKIYIFRYNIFLIFYNLLSHIYHPVWLVIIFHYLVYFLSLLFWFQMYDSISEIYSYFKFILR